MIEAEEKGINQKNVDQFLNDPSADVQRMLGTTPGIGKGVGLDDKWMYNIIKTVGNYSDVFERNLGQQSPLKLERGIRIPFKTVQPVRSGI
jgi:general L-amino acid transport system substrate-binding protein